MFSLEKLADLITDMVVRQNVSVGESLKCWVLHKFCHTIDINLASNRIVCNRCCLPPQNVGRAHSWCCLHSELWFDYRTETDSAAVNTLNYSPGSRIFGVNAMAFWLLLTLSQSDAIDVVAAAAVVVVTEIDSVAENPR